MMKKRKRSNLSRIIGILLILLLSACDHQDHFVTLKPKLDYSVQDKYLKELKPLFLSLNTEELSTNWGQEYQIGLAFARKLDLFHAISSFKRADILIPEENFKRRSEIQYQIVCCYYLGKKYKDCVEAFENSILANTDRNFIAFHDLLIMLFESYMKCQEIERAHWMLHTLAKFYPYDAKKLELSYALSQAEWQELKKLSNTEAINEEIALLESKVAPFDDDSDTLLIHNEDATQQELHLKKLHDIKLCQESTLEFLKQYHQGQKSPITAGLLNALMPGAGYLYIGQKQTAFTAFCINSLFIGAAAYSFMQGNIPLGVILTSFETGWYFGGILGAKEGALFYNERLYETKAHIQMKDHKLFPLLLLSHGF